VETQLIGVDTSARQVADLTGAVSSFCRGKGDGLVHVFAPHATAGVALMELGSGSESDLVEAIERLLPRDDRYRHRHGSSGHGADHLLPVFISPSMVLPVFDGIVQLGTWQQVVLVDTNEDNPHRTVRLSFVAG
jgi:secondary thiamine-phosphate synthase enzyme